MNKVKNFFVTLLWRLLYLIVIIIWIPIWTLICLLGGLAFILAIPFWFIMGGVVYSVLYEMINSIVDDVNNFFDYASKKTK